jgi:hypothetical protein
MSFEDLELKVKLFFLKYQKKQLLLEKERIRERIFPIIKQRSFFFNLPFFLLRHKYLSFFTLILGFFSLNFISINTPLAGQLETSGPVEIIRNNKSILTTKNIPLYIGDKIRVGRQQSAKITLPNNFTTTVSPKTNLLITEKDAIFLEKGQINNEVFRQGTIYTNRGIIKSDSGSMFSVTVSESGEASILPTKNKVTVYDLKDGNLILLAGESLSLRSDTELNFNNLPNDLNLSNTQIKSIYAKLIIARTKIISAVESQINNNNNLFQQNLTSASNSFKSVIQVLKTSRELEIARRRNIAEVEITQIYAEVSKKTNDQQLLKEIKALEALFTIVQQNNGKFAFAPTKTEILEYNKYTTLLNILSLANIRQYNLAEPLLQKYTVNFLNKIQNKPLKIDQITELNLLTNKLPKNTNSKKFLQDIQKLLAPDLADILAAKIDSIY